MLLKRNLLETVTIISCSGIILCILLNYVTNISPITGIWFISYLLMLFIVSVFGSFKFIQWLLNLNKPLKYDLENLLKKYPFLSFLSDVLPQIKKKDENEHVKEYDTNELSVITSVLEKKLVSSWYMTYISEEIGFPFACKQMLDQMIAKTFQICNKIETKDVYVDICAILITHLKEYKKALKRQESSPDSSIETLYKKIHPVFNNKNKKPVTAEHCTNVLRIVLKELVPWELWDTPYSELLVRILAKKLDDFIENTISDPVWINDRLFTLLKVKHTVSEDGSSVTPATEPIIEVEKTEPITKEPVPKLQPSPKLINKNVQSVIPKTINEESKEEDKMEVEKAVEGSEPVEIKPAAVLRQRRGRQGRNEVKIYDRIIEGSVKTWETDMDLQCISVGQDLLASLDEMTLSRLWGHEEAEHSPNIRGTSPQPLWFGEEDAIDLDQDPPKDTKKESSPKPTEALLKDLQTTVHHAKTKIGDLQVPLYIDVPRNHSSDEAAGMMEGLLDKGLAGIKKGLRFTGLSDDSQEKSPAHKDRNSEKISPSELHRSRAKPEVVMEVKESYMPFANQKEENGATAHHLVKQQRVASQDSMQAKPRIEWGAPAEPLSESPEPQYEEAADLSASIAKLRTLLQHAAPREEAWWEGAEETRGRPARTAHAHAHVDSAALADEYDMNSDRSSSPGQTTNNMQRLDKLFQRTVTGVFNSIKTAVGAEGEETAPRQLHDWTYVCTSPELSVSACAARLAGARRALWHVDAALDPLREIAPRAQPPAPPLDLEEWSASCGARWSGAAETCCAAGLAAHHLAFRLATLLCADLAESLICAWLDEFSAWLKKQIFVYFEQLSKPTVTTSDRKLREFNIDETCKLILETIPETYLFSEKTLSDSVHLVVSSFSHKEVNKDVIFRSLDIFAVHFKKSAGLRNPSFDNN